MNKLRTLFLAANPQGMSQLAIDQEIRQITEKIRLSEGRDVLEVITAWAVQPADLLQYLNQYEPQIVHFSGHGSQAGEIVLVDATGAAKTVSALALKALFTTLKHNIQLVVLNACYSRIQGVAINEAIDFVIGMNAAIGDRAAIVFAAALYSALGFGRTIKESFEQARTALLLESIPEEDTPELLVRPGARADRVLSSRPLGDTADASGEHALRLTLDRVAPLRETQHGRSLVYGTVPLSVGGTAYGKGLTLQLSLENLSDEAMVIQTIDLVVDDHDEHPLKVGDYQVLQTSGTHLEIPASDVATIELTELESTGNAIPMTKMRLFLKAQGSAESQHTVTAKIVAQASGLWKLRVDATFADARGMVASRTVSSKPFYILLH